MFDCPEKLKNYTGNKSIEGLYQFIINHIPKHRYYYELFGGSYGIYRMKKQADLGNYVVEKNKNVYKEYPHENTFYNGDAFIWLKGIKNNKNNFIYLDPPYEPFTNNNTKHYENSMDYDLHHKLLTAARTVKSNCMISCYPNLLYENMLHDWNRATHKVCIRGAVKTEMIYYNYELTELHEYTYLGSDCWERQRIKRKIDKMVTKLNGLPILEKNAILNTFRILQ